MTGKAPPENESTAVRIAAITGASRGIGAAIAAVLAEEGFSGLLGARTEADVTQLGAGLTGRWVGRRLDVSDARSVRAFRETAVDAFARVDVVVANAGVTVRARLDDYSEEDFASIFDVNVKGVWLTLKEFAGALTDGGLVVVVTSDVSTRVYEGGGPYAGSKAAARVLARTFQIEHPEFRVLELRPGRTATALGGEEAIRTLPEWALEPRDVAEVVRAAVRLPVDVRLEEAIVRSTGQQPTF